MKVVIESLGGVASRVRLGRHDLTFDQEATVPGGEDRGPSPLDVMATAVGACAHYYVAAFLFGRQHPAAGLRVEVEFEKGRDPVPRLATFSIHVFLPEGVPERYLAGIERAVRHCPAYGTFIHPPEIELAVHPGGAATSAPAA